MSLLGIIRVWTYNRGVFQDLKHISNLGLSNSSKLLLHILQCLNAVVIYVSSLFYLVFLRDIMTKCWKGYYNSTTEVAEEIASSSMFLESSLDILIKKIFPLVCDF